MIMQHYAECQGVVYGENEDGKSKAPVLVSFTSTPDGKCKTRASYIIKKKDLNFVITSS